MILNLSSISMFFDSAKINKLSENGKNPSLNLFSIAIFFFILFAFAMSWS